MKRKQTRFAPQTKNTSASTMSRRIGGGVATKRVQRNATDLEYLAKAKAAVRSRMLSAASEDLILAIVDVAKALIRGKIPLTNSQLAAARRRKAELQKLTRKNVRVNTKRALLEQEGNLLGVVLGPLIKGLAGPLIGSLLGGLTGGR